MKFLKRFFSIRTSKNKKASGSIHLADTKIKALSEEEHEEAIGRLLRSSSARYKVVSEVDYHLLPPLPHPINEVIQHPSSSSLSVAADTMSQRGTYTVTVHGRQPDVFSTLPDRKLDDDQAVRRRSQSTPPFRENSQFLGLRADPSVLSLLEMYDDKGKLAPDAFSSTPPHNHHQDRPAEGRSQTRRAGSTLRQLLGNPRSDESGLGDISWAERFLGESSSDTSSLTISTPEDIHFDGNSLPFDDARPDFLSTIDCDTSLATCNNFANSSMQVELSLDTPITAIDDLSFVHNPYGNPDPTTPRRASQVFDFIMEGRRPKVSTDMEATPVPRSLADRGSWASAEHSSLDCSSLPSCGPSFDLSASYLSDKSGTHESPTPSSYKGSFTSLPPSAKVLEPLPRPQDIHRQPNTTNDIKVIMTGPTKVIVTAPTPQCKTSSPSKLPRDHRSPSRTRTPSARSAKKRPALLVERSNPRLYSTQPRDVYPSVQSQHHSPSRSSFSSISLNRVEIGLPTPLAKGVHRKKSQSRSILVEMDKENERGLLVQHYLPTTPLRSKSDSKSLFRAIITPGAYKPPRSMTPSPTSSSELSPVGRQLMMDIRQQRSKARNAERARNHDRKHRS